MGVRVIKGSSYRESTVPVNCFVFFFNPCDCYFDVINDVQI